MRDRAGADEKISFLTVNGTDLTRGPGENGGKEPQPRPRRSSAVSESSCHVENPLAIRFCDCLLVATVVQLNVVGFWRGLFGILSIFHDYSQMTMVFLFGGLVQLQFTVWRHVYRKHLGTGKESRHVLLRRLYAYTSGSADVLHWAGLWFILEEMSGMDECPPYLYLSLSYAILVCFKFSKNLLSAPCTVSTDFSVDDFFVCDTAFKTEKKSSELSLYILDCFFSVFVIGSLVVFIWRGVWCLTDVFLFPENEIKSALGSLAIGYAIVIFIFCLQTPMEKLTEKLTGFWRLFVADVYVFISFIGTINLWRGIWNLLNIYFLPGSPILSYWITHLGCFAFLVLINCSNTILVRGVYIDGEDGGKCVVFPTFYFSILFQKFVKKKSDEGEMAQKSSSCSKTTADETTGENRKDPKTSPDESKKPQENDFKSATDYV